MNDLGGLGLVLLVCASCVQCSPGNRSDGGSGAGGGGAGGACEATSQTCSDWRCATGIVAGRNPYYGSSQVVLPLSGEFISRDGTPIVTFKVTTLPSGATQAVYGTSEQGCQLVSTLQDARHATVSWNGVELNGQGALTAAQRQALAELDASPFISALVQVPLQLGCQPDLPAEAVAALLFPWQVLLKYDQAPNSRAAGLEALGTASLCGYFGDRTDLDFGPIDGVQRLGPLQFASDDLIPNVYGYFALDGPGASEASGQPLEGDTAGPCKAKCRGACGEDCPPTCTVTDTVECSSDGGVDKKVRTYTCGVHPGCVAHDDCYDACNAGSGCGTWLAAVCRKGCDYNAQAVWGLANCSAWAFGYGSFTHSDDFRYETPAPGECSCVAPGTPVTMSSGADQPIEQVKVGEELLAFDVDAGAVIRAKVERVLVHRGDYSLDRLEASGGASLELTGNHPVFTLRGFVRTEDLVVGDTVFIVDEVAAQTRQEQLISIVRRASTSQVTYNLKTTAGNYFAADLLIHNKCLAAGSTVETRAGFKHVAAVLPGDEVRGVRAGLPTWTKVTAVYTKTTVLPALPGRWVNPELTLTDNHVLSAQGRPAGELNLPAVGVTGPVFDLETDTGNYFAGGVLLEAASSTPAGAR